MSVTYNVFKKKDGPGNYVFSDGRVGYFVPAPNGIQGMLETADTAQIAELTAVVGAGHPTIYIDGGQTTDVSVDASNLPPQLEAQEIRQDTSADNIDAPVTLDVQN